MVGDPSLIKGKSMDRRKEMEGQAARRGAGEEKRG